MATSNIQLRAARGGQVRGRANQRARWYLAVGILGGALLLALAVGIAARQAASTPAVAEAPAAIVPGNAAAGVSYRLSGPNELETDTTGAVPANGAPNLYRVSAPNETDPDGTVPSGAAPASYPPYRLSPPNEQEPSGP